MKRKDLVKAKEKKIDDLKKQIAEARIGLQKDIAQGKSSKAYNLRRDLAQLLTLVKSKSKEGEKNQK